jgi:hypothetical protein
MLGITDVMRYLDMELPSYIIKERLEWLYRDDMYEHLIGYAISESVFKMTGRHLCRVHTFNDAIDNCYDELRIYLVPSITNILVANRVDFGYATRVKYLISNLALVLVVVR